MIWVIDASVAIRWFLKDESHPNAEAVLQKVVHSPESFAVPELFAFEVYAVLCRIHPYGHDAFVRGMIPLLNSGIFRQPMTHKLANHADLFVKKSLTGYDAAYAALAKHLQGKWLTFDQKAHNLLQEEAISCDLTYALPGDW